MNLSDSTVFTELFMMVSGGRAGGFLLKSTIISTVLSPVELQVVKTTPDSQLLNLLSVSRYLLSACDLLQVEFQQTSKQSSDTCNLFDGTYAGFPQTVHFLSN